MREIGRGTRAFEHRPVRGHAHFALRARDLPAAAPGDRVVAVVRDPGAVWLRALGDALVAVVCTTGTPRSHVGILAGSLGLPCVVAAEFPDGPPPDGTEVEVDCSGDGDEGVIRG